MPQRLSQKKTDWGHNIQKGLTYLTATERLRYEKPSSTKRQTLLSVLYWKQKAIFRINLQSTENFTRKKTTTSAYVRAQGTAPHTKIFDDNNWTKFLLRITDEIQVHLLLRRTWAGLGHINFLIWFVCRIRTSEYVIWILKQKWAVMLSISYHCHIKTGNYFGKNGSTKMLYIIYISNYYKLPWKV